MVQVKKKDESFEDFNYQKVYQSVIAAGMEEAKARNIANEVQVWAQQSEGPVSTAEIRKRVIGLLEAEDLEIAESYRSYKEEDTEVID